MEDCSCIVCKLTVFRADDCIPAMSNSDYEMELRQDATGPLSKAGRRGMQGKGYGKVGFRGRNGGRKLEGRSRLNRMKQRLSVNLLNVGGKEGDGASKMIGVKYKQSEL